MDDRETREALERATPIVVAARGRGLSRHNFPAVERKVIQGTPEGLAEMSRWLPGAPIHGGRPSQRDSRLADYATAIVALAEKGWREGEITAPKVLRQIHRTGSESQLRADIAIPEIGGWRRFRARVLGSR